MKTLSQIIKDIEAEFEKADFVHGHRIHKEDYHIHVYAEIDEGSKAKVTGIVKKASNGILNVGYGDLVPFSPGTQEMHQDYVVKMGEEAIID